MIIELRTYRISCDRCGTSIVLQDTSRPVLPAAWVTEEMHDCGLTGYTSALDLCPACDPKLGKNRKSLLATKKKELR